VYGSEVWGVGNKFRDSDPFEHLHLKCIKEMLGVQCKIINVACLAETNRTPLHAFLPFSIYMTEYI
jgi:hypothetical protein